MKIEYVAKEYHDCELADFPAWGGAVYWLEELKEHPVALAAVEDELYHRSMEPEALNELTDEDINDILWFETPDILYCADLYDWKTDTIYDEPFGWED